MNKGIGFALMLLLAGCGSGGKQQASDVQNESQAAAKPTHAWTRFADGSKGWLERSPSDKFNNASLERCWPVNGKWDCLSANTLEEVGSFDPPTVFAIRYTKAAFDDPALGMGSDEVRSGYGCQLINGKMIQEYIFTVDASQETNTLQKNDVLLNMVGGGSAWPIGYAERFMRENGVKPTANYLDCMTVTKLVADNSLATLNTTALSHDMMVGRVESMLGSE